MAYQCLLSASAWDAVAWVRNKTEDTTAPFIVSDAAMAQYVEEVAEEMSRWLPIEDKVGNPYANTSPLLTVRGVQRYACTPANGFPVEPKEISDVLYQASGLFSANSEIAYLAMLPFSPMNRFLLTPNILDAPSERILRDEWLSEIDHYGIGQAGIVRDRGTGLLAIDLYPVPGFDGLPIFVRYTANWISVPAGGNDVFVKFPEAQKRNFAKLLYAAVLEQEANRLWRYQQGRTGNLQFVSNPELVLKKVEDLRTEVQNGLGGAVPEVAINY